MNMKMFKQWWENWAKALGAKAYDEDDKRSDVVAIIRTVWVILGVVTSIAIILNAIATHGFWGLIGL